MIQTISLTDARSLLPPNIDIFICCASFEKRSLSIALALDPTAIGASIVSQVYEFEDLSNKNYTLIQQALGKNVIHTRFSSVSPLVSADALSNGLQNANLDDAKTVVADITTFTRETLLMLLKLLWNWKRQDQSKQLIFVYNPADEMNDEWLSKRLIKLRSVVGYSGLLGSAKPLHAVVLAGFEIDRARDTLDILEPDLISIGVGRKEDSTNPNFFERNSNFVAELVSYYGASVKEFTFSLADPEKTKLDITTQINLFSEYGTIVVPLNNKISTLGAGLLALEKEDIQICYSQMAIYNSDNYSVPSGKCVLISI